MKNLLKLFFTLTVIVVITISYAQIPIEKSTEKVRIEGKHYYIHYVKKGETLYSLGKVYGVTVSQIVDNNPELTTGLKEGHSIKIPILSDTATGEPLDNTYSSTVNVVHSSTATQNTPIPNQVKKDTTPTVVSSQPSLSATALQYHLVKANETATSIATHYGTTEAELKKLNPEAFMNNKLQQGTLLQLPKKIKITEGIDTTKNTTEWQADSLEVHVDTFGIQQYLDIKTDTTAYRELLKQPVKATLVLPFIRNNTSEDNEKIARTKNPENFFAFYKGALLAIEKLKQEGLSLQLSVHDSYTIEKVEELLANNELLEQDIIIGPVYASNLQPVAKYGKMHQIKMVSPLDPHAEDLTIDNPYLFQLSPPTYCRQKKLIDDVLTRENTNIILIYDKNRKDSLLIESYKKLLGDSLANVKFYGHQVQKGTTVRDSLRKKLNPQKLNCILLASNDEAIISDISANLYLFTFRNRYQITLYGTERWRNFETVDLKYLHALNLHLVVPFFIDYEAADVQDFITKFHEVYQSEPSQYAFQGYDTFYYFLQAIMRYGKNFENYLTDYDPQLLQTKYNFKHNRSYSNGLMNVESCLINYTPQYKIERR